MKKTILGYVFVATMPFVALVGCGGAQKTNLTPSAREQTVEQVPDFYLNPPTDPSFLFATSSATSRDLQMSLDKAKTAGRVELAKQMEVKMNNLTQNFGEEVGEGDDSELLQTFTSVTKSVASQTLNGSRVVESKVLVESGIYRAYVLMSLPIGEANRQLMQEIRENKNLYTRFRATQAFEELDKELKALGE